MVSGIATRYTGLQAKKQFKETSLQLVSHHGKFINMHLLLHFLANYTLLGKNFLAINSVITENASKS